MQIGVILADSLCLIAGAICCRLHGFKGRDSHADQNAHEPDAGDGREQSCERGQAQAKEEANGTDATLTWA